MEDIHLTMVFVCLIWLAATVYVVRLCQHSRVGSVGLPAAYAFSTTFLFASAFLYCIPGYSHRRVDSMRYLWSYNITNETVLAGAIQTCIALVGFAVGVKLYHARQRGAVGHPVVAYREKDTFGRDMPILVVLAISGFAITFLRLDFPMAAALSLVGQNVGTVLVCLGYFHAQTAGNSTARSAWMAAGIAIPLWNMASSGFLSSGFTVATIVGAFLMMTTNARRWSLVRTSTVLVGVAYSWLAIAVVYLSGREEIRNVIWNNADFSDRISVLYRAFSEIKLLSPFDFVSLDWIAARLNQAAFVGKMVEWHDLFPDLRTYGASLLFGLLAWVPRAMWPGKPENAGNQFIEANTGLRFSEGAKFGAGQIFEFYVSLGSLGVFLGMIAMGLIIASLDGRAARALRTNRLHDCVRSFAIGAAMIVPLSDVFFMVSTCAATWITLTGISFATRALGTAPNRIPALQARR